jgi:hypothetical protein
MASSKIKALCSQYSRAEKLFYKWVSSFCIKRHPTPRYDTNRNKVTFKIILTILRKKAASFLVCHLTILPLLHAQKPTEQNKEMQTLAKSVTQNKATSCNSLPSLTTETFPYLSHVCTPSPPPNMEQPQTKRVQQKSMSTE